MWWYGERKVFVYCILYTVYSASRGARALCAYPLGASLTLRTVRVEGRGMRVEELRARLVVRLVRLAARLARLDFVEIEKYSSNHYNRPILSVLRDFSRISIYHSLSLCVTLCHSFSFSGNGKDKGCNFAT